MQIEKHCLKPYIQRLFLTLVFNGKNLKYFLFYCGIIQVLSLENWNELFKVNIMNIEYKYEGINDIFT